MKSRNPVRESVLDDDEGGRGMMTKEVGCSCAQEECNATGAEIGGGGYGQRKIGCVQRKRGLANVEGGLGKERGLGKNRGGLGKDSD